jgi:UDP-N-acetylglucosamine/UDP-N-acetylgalactosamine diphosphorylase
MGVAEEAVFLGREHSGAPPTTGVGFRVRKGSIYEEGACSGQHTDTKMTLLMPWVTLGSNINFCDVLLAGGTGDLPGQFSEVGSGTIHFNFTIRGDKATASLLGNVCEGVFLRSERLFIGGNCSLLGPLLAEFGAFSAAGVRLPRQLASGLNLGTAHLSGHKNYDPRCFPNLRWIVSTQLQFFGELVALFHWYHQVRVRIAIDTFVESLYRQGQYVVQRNLEERIAQLQLLTELVAENQSHSERVLPETKLKDQRAWLQGWAQRKEQLQSYASIPNLAPEILLRELVDAEGTYTRRIQQLSPATVEVGQQWLEGITKPFFEGELG